MRNAIILFFVLLFVGPAFGQAPEKLFVGNCSFSGFSLLSDSTYRGNITRFDDRMGDGYNLTQLAVGYEIFDGRGLVFTIDTIHTSTNFTADVSVTAKIDRGFEPFGSGQVYQPTANGLIPPSSQEQAGLSPTQKARIDRHNVVTMQTLVGVIVDSTRLIQDSILVYYQEGSEVGRDTISGTGGGGLSGSGTTGNLARWASSSSLTDADITDNGTAINIGASRDEVTVEATDSVLVDGPVVNVGGQPSATVRVSDTDETVTVQAGALEQKIVVDDFGLNIQVDGGSYYMATGSPPVDGKNHVQAWFNGSAQWLNLTDSLAADLTPSLITYDSVSTARIATIDTTTTYYISQTGLFYRFFPEDSRTDNNWTIIENGSGALVSFAKANIEPEFDVFLWWGQSNSMGRDTAEAQDSTAYKVYELCRGKYGSTDGEIRLAENPMQFFDNDSYGMSPALEFGRYIQSISDRKILIIPQSHGGYPIANLQKESPVNGAGTTTNVYTDLINRITPLLQSPKFDFKGIFWQQGESDNTTALRPLYKREFARLMQTLKQDLGTNVPIFQMGMPESYAGVGNVLNATIASLDTTLWGINNYFVTQSGLFRMNDQVHWENDEYRKIGIRAGKKIQQVVYGEYSVPEQPFLRVFPTGTDTATLEWEHIYSPYLSGLTDIKIYINGAYNSTLSNLIADHNNQYSVTITGVTLSSTNIQIAGVNAFGEGPKSAENSITYNSTAPTPTHWWKLDETTGTTITDSGTGGVNGTLTTDASSLTTTFAGDGGTGFDFDGTNIVNLASLITMSSESDWTIAWEAEDAPVNKIIFGDYGNAYNYVATFETLRFYTRHHLRNPTGFSNSGLKKNVIVCRSSTIRFYQNGTWDGVQKYGNTQFSIDTIGDGYDNSSFRYTGKLKNLRIWKNTALNVDQIQSL